MHNMNQRYKKMNYYARILIAVSLAFLVYGLILDINNDVRLIDPLGVENKDSGKTFVEVGKESNNSDIDVDEDEDDYIKSGDDTEVNEGITSSNYGNTQALIPTLDETNNSLRNNIQNAFGVTIYYGSETDGYNVGGLDTISITNPYVVNSSLNNLYNAMSLFPDGFFQEIRDGGIPLTIYLIDSYSSPGVTGVTDSNLNFAHISIAIKYGFNESFFHECYHYIERYMIKNDFSFNSWDSYNPDGFSYGTKNSSYVYNVTFDANSYFVNSYAQTDQYEDRASTFEYMMDSTKASCLNSGMPIWKKATIISSSIDAVMNTVNPYTTEYWERYL